MSESNLSLKPAVLGAGDSAILPLLAPADLFDPVIEAYKVDVDRTLIRENLKLTPEQRVRKLQDFVGFLVRLRNENSAKQVSR